MSYRGDYAAGSVIRFKFNTFQPTTGAPFALAGSPSLAAYKDDSDVQDTDGLTLTASFDGISGLNHVVVDTSADATFYSNGSSFEIVLAAGTVDGVSVAGVVVGSFTLRKTSLSSGIVDAIVDAVWDEVLTAATHNVAASAGRRLRQLSDVVVYEGTAQGPGTGPNQIQLDTGASSTSGAYDPSAIAIIGGTGAGQCRMIFQYDGATRTATVDRDWRVAPDATSVFQITSNPGREHVNEGLAQGGTANTITLNANASATDNAYVGQIAFIRAGTGADQVGLVTAYNGTTKVATINHDWPVAPDTTSAYAMLPAGPVMLAGIVHTGATIPTVTTVSGSVGSVAADGITSSSMAASAITEIQSGLATAAAVADVDADVVAIKAKTDLLTFSGSNLLSDIRAVRGDTIVENGSASTNWGKAP